MKINFNKSLKKNKRISIHSVFYPAAGYVAIPENNTSGFEQEKQDIKIRRVKQEPGSTFGMIKGFLYYIVSAFKNRERGQA